MATSQARSEVPGTMFVGAHIPDDGITRSTVDEIECIREASQQSVSVEWPETGNLAILGIAPAEFLDLVLS